MRTPRCGSQQCSALRLGSKAVSVLPAQNLPAESCRRGRSRSRGRVRAGQPATDDPAGCPRTRGVRPLPQRPGPPRLVHRRVRTPPHRTWECAFLSRAVRLDNVVSPVAMVPANPPRGAVMASLPDPRRLWNDGSAREVHDVVITRLTQGPDPVVATESRRGVVELAGGMTGQSRETTWVRLDVPLGGAVGYWHPAAGWDRHLAADWMTGWRAAGLADSAPLGCLHDAEGDTLLGYATDRLVATTPVKFGVGERTGRRPSRPRRSSPPNQATNSSSWTTAGSAAATAAATQAAVTGSLTPRSSRTSPRTSPRSTRPGCGPWPGSRRCCSVRTAPRARCSPSSRRTLGPSGAATSWTRGTHGFANSPSTAAHGSWRRTGSTA